METDTVRAWHIDRAPTCPLVMTLNILGGKWKPLILHRLASGTLRFGELRKRIPAVSQKMLTQQLRELEADGMIIRTVFPEIPPRVEYRLSDRGISLRPLLDQLYRWGQTELMRGTVAAGE